MSENRTLVVREIKREGDRTLLYGDDRDYHVIAGASVEVEVGDTIVYEYEPDNLNFGWFVSKVSKSKK